MADVNNIPSYVLNGLNLDKIKEKTVFLSYGHDHYLPYSRRLAKDLRCFVKHVWFDEDCIRSAHKWDNEIEEGISSSDTIIAMMTRHAYRRPSGVCLNEVVYATSKGKEIVPMLVEQISVPLLLCNIQYVDVCDIYDPVKETFSEEAYYDTLKRLLLCIENPGDEMDSKISMLKRFLQPVNNQIDISEKTKDFVGREWLIDLYNSWIEDDDKSSVYYLMGGPGTGKSSFSAHLSMISEHVKGIHFCKYNDKYSVSVKAIIKTLAYYLATQIPEYWDYIDFLDMEKIVSSSENELFQTLLIQPLKNISKPSGKIVLVLDGLDEMDEDAVALFIELVENYFDTFPSWFRLILTSRNNPRILNLFKKIEPYVIDTEGVDNLADVRKYLSLKLNGVIDLDETQITEIIDRSEGVFQYIIFLIQDILRNRYNDFEEITLPRGLFAAYTGSISRCFGNKSDFDKLLPALEVLCAAQEPLALNDIREIFSNGYIMKQALQCLGDYIVNRGNFVEFFHKSIKDWFTDEINNVDYYVDSRCGHSTLAHWAIDCVDIWKYDNYLYKYGFYHMYESGNYAFICEAINEDDNVYYDSFLDFLEKILKDHRSVRKLFKEIKNNVNNLEFLLCKVIREFYDRMDCKEFIELIIDGFSDCYEWLEQYSSLYEALINSNLEKILVLGEVLKTQLNNKDVKLEIDNYIGDSYRLMGNHEKAFESYKNVMDGYPERMRAQKCFLSMYNYYDLRYVRGYLSEAQAEIEKIERQVPDKTFEKYKVWRLKGNINYQAGRRLEAVDCFRKSLEIAEYIRRPLYIAEANYSVAEALVGLDNEQALVFIETAKVIADKIHSRIALSRSYFAYIEMLVNQEKWEDAIEHGKIGAELVRETGYLTGVARIYQSMALAYYHTGEYKLAIEYARFAHNRYIARDSYPAARVLAWRTILEASDKLGTLKETTKLDSLDNIINLQEFENLDKDISVINQLLEKGTKQ